MFVIDAFGAQWALDLSGLEEPLANSLRRLWSRARVTDGGTGLGEDVQPFVVARAQDGTVTVGDAVHRGSDDDLPYAMSRALTLASIRRRAGRSLMLHAAGLALPDGSTVALVGASGTGKTTASRALGRALGYVSDETVAIDPDGRVRSWAKPLSVVVGPDSRWEKHEHSPDELGLLHAPEMLHLGAVVVLTREPGLDGPPVLEQIDLVDAMNLVLPQTSSLLELERPLSRLAALLTTGEGPWRLTYRDIEDCADLIVDVAGTSRGWAPGPGLPWVSSQDEIVDPESMDLERTKAQRAEGVTRATVVRRCPHRDAVTSGAQTIVLRRAATTLLPGLASILWEALDGPREVAALVRDAEASFGVHPQSAAMVLETVRDLVRTGLVTARVDTLDDAVRSTATDRPAAGRRGDPHTLSPMSDTIDVTTPDGPMPAHVWLPASGRGPGILLLQEIFGVSDYIRRRAEDLAALGYVVLAPEVFWRLGVSEVANGPEMLDEAMGLLGRLDWDAAVADSLAALDVLRSRPEVTGSVGVVGFCFGGGLGYAVAAASPVDALVSFYGSALPDLVNAVPSVSTPSLHHFGESDSYIPIDTVERIRDSVSAGGPVEFHTYPGADHAFDNSDFFGHHPEASALAWQRTEDWLAGHLPVG